MRGFFRITLLFVLVLIMVGCSGQEEHVTSEDVEKTDEVIETYFLELPVVNEVIVTVIDENIVEEIQLIELTEINEVMEIEEILPDLSPFEINGIYHIRYQDGFIHISLQRDAPWIRPSILLDSRGNVLLAPATGAIRDAQNFEKYATVMESLGHTVIPYGFQIERFTEPTPYGLIIVRSHASALSPSHPSTKGIINSNGEWIFEPQSGVMIRGFENNEYMAITIGNHYSRTQIANTFLIDSTGQTVFPLPHMDIYSRVVNARTLGYGLVAARVREVNTVESQNNSWYGIYDMLGNELIPPSLRHVRPFNEGVAIMIGMPYYPWLYSFYGAIDTQGSVIIPPRYSMIVRFYEGLAGMYIGGWNWTRGSGPSNAMYWGFVDTEGNEVIPPRFRLATNFTNGVAVVDYKRVCNFACRCQGPEGIALINTRGEYVIPPYAYYNIWVCDQGLVFTVTGTAIQELHPNDFGEFIRQRITNPRIGIRDSEGNILAPPIYSNVRTYELSSEGQWLWPEMFIYPPPVFREGRAAVQCYYTGLWGYIDMDGYEVIPTQFTHVGTFINGVALVNVGGEPASANRLLKREGVHRGRWGGVYTHYFSVEPVMHGTWHIIDLYGNILESFEHIYMANVNGFVFVYTNEIEEREVDSNRRGIESTLVDYRIFVLERDWD